MMWNNGPWGVGDWVAMSLMMIVFWGLLVAIVVLLIRSTASARTRSDVVPPMSAPPEEALAQRFARGEIDEAQLIRGRELLSNLGPRQ